MNLPYEVMAVAQHGGTIYNPGRHRILEHSDWLESVKRRAIEAGFPFSADLGLYHHTVYNTFVFFLWARRRGDDFPGVMHELFALPFHPDHEKPKGMEAEELPPLDAIIKRLQPEAKTIREARQRMEDEEHRQRQAIAFQAEQKREYAKAMGKAAGPVTKHLIETSQIPVHFDEPIKGL